MSSPINAQRSEDLTRVIVSCGEEVTAAFLEIVAGIADPSGDKFRYEAAQAAIRTAVPFSSRYSELCDSYFDRTEVFLSVPDLPDH